MFTYDLPIIDTYLKNKGNKMKTREEIKAIVLERKPNFCNDLRESDCGEYKNYTDEECLDWWVLAIEAVANAESKQ